MNTSNNTSLNAPNSLDVDNDNSSGLKFEVKSYNSRHPYIQYVGEAAMWMVVLSLTSKAIRRIINTVFESDKYPIISAVSEPLLLICALSISSKIISYINKRLWR